ncbi:hypothetical protein CCMSSC00406_0005095 [Pleurotus cornucopiae]|uniref:Uncharacterized protein n=1 Tax=Pleurotus cornucopiae TaxID=5321 RepID=A0ACB7J6G8_PLECO|nr:hypothetical protein CCMSSC00406_0005095 [Pleurotus cornucopiae]
MNHYLDVNLDSLPPPSRFRRPWSPDPYDPLPPASSNPNLNRREPSDVSIEALDLADYARTLQQPHQPYPAFYPPSPHALASRTDSPSLPSLTSRVGTLSSNSRTHESSSSRYPTRRPFSLPSAPSPHHRQSPLYASQRPIQFPDDPNGQYSPHINPSSAEIDISQFPRWSRQWYNSKPRNKSPLDDGYDLPEPLPYRNDRDRDPFDPSNTPSHSSYNPYRGDSPSGPPSTSFGHQSSRDLLPWSGDPPSYDLPLDSSIKEERMRMLEREFGDNPKRPKFKDPKGKGKMDPAFLDDEGRPIVGTVDEKGNLVTQGPRKRIAIRALQIILAMGAAIPALYAALAIKPNPPAPPSNTAPVYVLYVLSVLTTLLLIYLFVLRPCCFRRKLPSSGMGQGMGPPGMMVLPVNQLPSGKGKKNKQKGKGGKKGKKGYGPPQVQDVQVNLIVDPSALAPPDISSSESDSESRDDSYEFPGGYDSQRRRERNRARAKRQKRRSIFTGLAMEEHWLAARKYVKRLAVMDGLLVLLWAAEFVFLLSGVGQTASTGEDGKEVKKGCPSGGFEGWCDAYNTSLAAACLLAVCSGVSLFFGVKDLGASKVSPRSRM